MHDDGTLLIEFAKVVLVLITPLATVLTVYTYRKLKYGKLWKEDD